MPMEELGLLKPLKPLKPLTNIDLIWITEHALLLADYCINPKITQKHYFISRELYFILVFFYGTIYADHKIMGCKIVW